MRFSTTTSPLDRNNGIKSPGLSAEIAEPETIIFAPASAALWTVEGAMSP